MGDKEEKNLKVEEPKKIEVKKGEQSKDVKVKDTENKEKAKKDDKSKKVENKVKGNVKVENKKSSKMPIIIGTLLVVILILIVLAATFLTNTPNKTVEKMLQALKDGNYEEINKYINYEELMSSSDLLDNDESNEEFQKLLFEKLSWKVTQTKLDNDVSTVTIDITNKNFKTIINNYMQKILKIAFSSQNISDQETESYLIDELKNDSVDTITETQTINLVKQDGKWVITTTGEELIDMLLPGLSEAVNSLS